MVERVVQAAAFLALEGALDDQPRHCRDVAQLQQVGRHNEVPVVIEDFALQVFNARLGPLQPLGLYAANSFFVDGYLTEGGQPPAEDYRMIEALGFSIAR